MSSCRWALPFGDVPMHPTCAERSIGHHLRICQLRTPLHDAYSRHIYSTLSYHLQSEVISTDAIRRLHSNSELFRLASHPHLRMMSVMRIFRQLKKDLFQEHKRIACLFQWSFDFLPLMFREFLHGRIEVCSARRDSCYSQAVAFPVVICVVAS